MPLRIARLPYLHAEPFYFDMARRRLALVELVPRAVARAAAHGAIDAGPVPVVDVMRLQDRFQPLSGFCIASAQEASGSLLFSSQAIDTLAGARIAVSDEASTAPRLLDILLRLKYRLRPAAYEPLQSPHDALLLIGNEALRQRRGAAGFPYSYDLGVEWHAWTGLPCVFSRWMVRKDVAAKDRALLEEALFVGVEEGVDALCHLSQPRQDLFMLPRDIAAYIQGFRYYVGRAEERAMEQLQRYLQQLEG